MSSTAIDPRDEELARLRKAGELVSAAYLGWSPDLNTQTPAEVEATEGAIREAVEVFRPSVRRATPSAG